MKPLNRYEVFRIILLALIVLTVSCEGTKDNVDKRKEYWITGTLSTKNSIDTIVYCDCYCNLIGSKITINYANFGAGRLIATLRNGDTDIDLSYFKNRNRDYGIFSYDTKTVSINQSNPKLGEWISGNIILTGQSHNRDNEIYDLNLKGNFRCILKDSTYHYSDFHKDKLIQYDSIAMIKLRKIAYSNPDSVLELHLQYPNFYLVKDHVHLFRNLQRLSLDEFPPTASVMISDFKQLKALEIYGQSQSGIPTNIGELKHLQLLHVKGPTGQIPESFYTLTELKELDVEFTNIKSISPRVKNLKSLETLNIANTEITHIPLEIFQLSRLKDLTLPDDIVPFYIKNLNFDSLKILHVSYNFLVYNRHYLEKLKGLEQLYPNLVYASHEEYIQKYGQIEWLQKKLPNVRIDKSTYIW